MARETILWRVTYTARDYVLFASKTEPGQVVTEPLLHGWALSFALARYQGLRILPDYEADLSRMPVYATPAEVIADTYEERTTIHNHPGFEDATAEELNTMTFEHHRTIAPGTQFEGYCFASAGWVPPIHIRVGRYRRLVEVEAWPLGAIRPVWIDGPERLTHLVVVDDLPDPDSGAALTVIPEWIRIPPTDLLRRPMLQNFHGMRVGEHVVLVPKRIREGRLTPIA